MEDLLTVAAEVEDVEDLRGLAAYYRLRESGLRRRALEALDAFLTGIATWSESQRRAAAGWLMSARDRHPRLHVLPHPLQEKLVVPALEQWMRDDPAAGAPRRWLGILRHDPDLLEEALRCDPADDIARATVVARLIRAVDFATHHLSEGTFLGSVDDALDDLRRAREHIALLQPSPRRDDFEWSANALESLIADWQEYTAEERSESFQAWCESRGFEHDWWSIVYYDRG